MIDAHGGRLAHAWAIMLPDPRTIMTLVTIPIPGRFRREKE